MSIRGGPDKYLRFIVRYNVHYSYESMILLKTFPTSIIVFTEKQNVVTLLGEQNFNNWEKSNKRIGSLLFCHLICYPEIK